MKAHVIPVGGAEPLHVAGSSCWCHPMESVRHPGVIIHNAKDCREKWERRGYHNPATPWVSIAGDDTVDVLADALRTAKEQVLEMVTIIAEARARDEAPPILIFNGAPYFVR